MTRQVDVKALVSHIVKGDGLDKCRICMGDTSQGLVFLEDTVMLDGDQPVTLAELLQVITGVEVQLDDGLPNGICSTCSDSALRAAEFRCLCRQAAKQLENTLKLLYTLPDHQYSQDSEKLFAILTDNDVCIIDYSSENTYSSKKLSSTIVKIKGDHEVRKIYAKSHRCQCPNCGKKFKYAQHLSQHLKESSDNIRACHMCAKIMSQEDLLKHLPQVHSIEPYNCIKCPAIYHSYKQYKQHLNKAHASGACTCGDCGRSFHSSNAFHAHLSVHSLKTCPGCDKLFRNQKCYFYHVKHCCNLDGNREDTHRTKYKVTVLVENKENKKVKVGMRGSTAYKECICDYCKKKFSGKKFVAAHIQIVHTKDTHRPCMYCGKFLAAAHMSTHLKKHESAESYKCEHCGVMLKTKLGFSQHLRLHTGERPYTCQYCGESFSASSRRSEHIRNSHKRSEIILKHGCDYCPARFRLPFKLKKHIESVHKKGTESGAWFECTDCKEKFVSCRSLLHHKKKHQ